MELAPACRIPRPLRWTRQAACAMLAAIFAFVACASPSMVYACRVDGIADWAPAFALAGIALVLLAGIAVSRVRCAGFAETLRRPKTFWTVFAVGIAALVACQAAVVAGGWFVGGWDVGIVSHRSVYDEATVTEYLSHYPNNLALYGLFGKLEALGAALGMAEPYLACVVGACACVTASTALSVCCARRLFGLGAGYLALALGAVFVGLSPWILVPYSDAYGMLCPTVVLFCFVTFGVRPASVAAMTAATVVGYSVKPTAVFVTAGVVIVWAAFAWQRRSERAARPEKTARRAAASIVALALGAAVGMGAVACAEGGTPELDESKAVPFAHFFMMGSNPEQMGYFSAEDEAFTFSLSNPAERTRGDLERWAGRLADMGPAGTAELAARKLLTVYGDGTLAWNQEGGFFAAVHGDSAAVKAFYGIPQATGEDPAPGSGSVYRAVWQALWMTILAGAAARAFSRTCGPGEAVIAFSVIALTAFLLLSEARARYLVLYAPFYVVLCCGGVMQVSRMVSRRREAVAQGQAERTVRPGAVDAEGESLCIVMPAYNESETIRDVVASWYGVVERVGNGSRLVVFDDGSTDGTYALLKELAAGRPRLDVRTKPNSGHGATIHDAYRHALSLGVPWVFQTDSDGQTEPEEFWEFWRRRGEWDAVIGQRTSRKDGLSRVVVTRTLRLAVLAFFHVWVPDANTPFRLMRASVLAEDLPLVPEGYNLTNVALSATFAKRRRRVLYLPITFRERQGGVNSINIPRIVRIGLRALGDFARLNARIDRAISAEGDAEEGGSTRARSEDARP